MDSELFTVGGVDDGRSRMDRYGNKVAEFAWRGKEYKDPASMPVGYLYLSGIKFMHATKWVMRALYVVLVLLVIRMFINLAPDVYSAYRRGFWNQASNVNVTTKEGLQYLGASTNVLRDDMGWIGKDSLAEEAMRKQSIVTAEAPIKANFIVTRDGSVVVSPEEELLKKQQNAAAF